MKATAKQATARFSVKGQIVIPKWLRTEYAIREGTQAYMVATDKGILLAPLTARHIHSLRGSLTGSKAMRVLQDERRKEREL